MAPCRGSVRRVRSDCGSDAGPGPNHSYRFFVRDATGGAHRATGTIAPNSQWHHAVGVCDESDRIAAVTPGLGQIIRTGFSFAMPPVEPIGQRAPSLPIANGTMPWECATSQIGLRQ